jgi:hypothetical protein
MNKFCCLLFAVLTSFAVEAQWIKTDGPGGGKIISLASGGNELCAGTTMGRVYVSQDSGLTWTGNKVLGWVSDDIEAVAISGSLVFAGTDGSGLFRSTNSGATWSQVGSGYSPLNTVTAITIKGVNIFVGTSTGYLYRSTDSGVSWVQLTVGVPVSYRINTLVNDGVNVFAGANGVYRTINNGASWTLMNTGFGAFSYSVESLAIYDTTIVAGVAGSASINGMYKSVNNGASWIRKYFGPSIMSVAIYGPHIYCGNSYHSSDYGATWTSYSFGMTSIYISDLAMVGSRLYAGTDAAGVFVSTNNSVNWAECNVGLTATSVGSIDIDGSTIFAETDGRGCGVFSSNDDGATWTPLNDTLKNLIVYAVETNGSKLFACGSNLTTTGVCSSSDNGLNWTFNWTVSPGDDNSCMASNGPEIYIGSIGQGVWKSNNNGLSWFASSAGLPAGSEVYSIHINGVNIFISTNSGIYLSTDAGATWASANTGIVTTSYIRSFASIGTMVFAAHSYDGVYVTTDSGGSWTLVNTGLTNLYMRGLVASGTNLYASNNAGVFLSTNNGGNWTSVSTGLSSYVLSLAANSTTLFAGTFDGIWKRSLADIESTIKVWPGDANHDYIADNTDLLPIGLYYGQTGTPRASISNLWSAYTSAGWGVLQSNGADIKHADCNGDGTIDNNDTLAINLNYALTHTFAPIEEEERLTAPAVYLTSASGSYVAGSTATIEVWLGTATVPVNDLYGIAFDINYDASLVQPGTESLTYPNSWLGSPGTDAINVSKVDAILNTAFGAETRIDHLNADGFGKIAEFKMQIKSSLAMSDTLHFSVACLANDSAGAPVLFDPVPYYVLVNPVSTDVNQASAANEIRVYPNPFSESLTVSFDHIVTGGKLVLVDLTGRELKRMEFSGENAEFKRAENILPGMYLLQVMEEGRKTGVCRIVAR